MANLYVGQFKDVLKQYSEKQSAYNAEIIANNQRYSFEYAESENSMQIATLYGQLGHNKRPCSDMIPVRSGTP